MGWERQFGARPEKKEEQESKHGGPYRDHSGRSRGTSDSGLQGISLAAEVYLAGGYKSKGFVVYEGERKDSCSCLDA